MNKKRIIILIFAISLLTYFLLTLMRINAENDEKQLLLKKIEDNEKKIEKEKRNNNKLGNIDSQYVENLYFEKERDYFEDYIRSIFNKYKIIPTLYQSKLNEKKYSEINLDFKINSIDFFHLIYDLERGNKHVMIKSFTIKKDKDFNIKINMKLRGFYK